MTTSTIIENKFEHLFEEMLYFLRSICTGFQLPPDAAYVS
jgi:hypothetical protein